MKPDLLASQVSFSLVCTIAGQMCVFFLNKKKTD